MKIILIKLTIILVTGPFGLTKDQARDAYQEVKSRLITEVGIELKLKKLSKRADIYKQFSTLNSKLQRYLAWKVYLTSIGRLKSKELVHLIFPPMPHYDGKRYIAGYASSICTFKKFRTMSLSNAQMTNQDGAARFQHSTLAMLHEISHIIGATHQDWTPNVMHSAAMAYLPTGSSHWALPMLPVSVQQIRKCL
jgi:hypothetical protein